MINQIKKELTIDNVLNLPYNAAKEGVLMTKKRKPRLKVGITAKRETCEAIAKANYEDGLSIEEACAATTNPGTGKPMEVAMYYNWRARLKTLAQRKHADKKAKLAQVSPPKEVVKPNGVIIRKAPIQQKAVEQLDNLVALNPAETKPVEPDKPVTNSPFESLVRAALADYLSDPERVRSVLKDIF